MNKTMKKPTTWKTPPMEAPLRPFFGDGMEVTWNNDHDDDHDHDDANILW